MASISHVLLTLSLLAAAVSAALVEYTFDIRPTLSLSPDCYLGREVLAVNNMVPGPVVRANLGDTIRVTINNHSPSQSVSIHWHGLHQKQSPYSDGFATVSQCPLGPLQSEVHEFIADVAGTHYWHGHVSMSKMDGMQGFLIVDDIHNKREQTLRKKYNEEILIFLQDWFHKTGETIRTGLDSDPLVWIGHPQSMLINQAGPFDGCSEDLGNCDLECVRRGHTTFHLEQGKTYRLRIVNAAATEPANFAIAKHRLEVVEADGTLVKKTKVDNIEITSGQRYSVLLKANQEIDNYWARLVPRFFPEDFTYPVGYALFHYAGADATVSDAGAALLPPTDDDVEEQKLPSGQPENRNAEAGPAFDAKLFTRGPTKGLKKRTDKEIVLALSNGFLKDTGLVKAAVNNISQHFTGTPVVHTAYHLAKNAGEWPTDLTGSGLQEVPAFPPQPWNYSAPVTAGGPGVTVGKTGVPIISVAKGDSVQIVLQNSVLALGGEETHPFHLHGHSLYEVGRGVGSFSSRDAANFNLKNPVRRDTTTVWPSGWTAIRFVANNPGVWPFHCHNAAHSVLGMGVLIVVSPEELPTPPEGVTSCTKTNFSPIEL